MNEIIEDNKCTHCFLEFILLTKLLKLTKHVCMHYFVNNKSMNFSFLKNHEFFFISINIFGKAILEHLFRDLSITHMN